jgi:hypothetical protein
MRNRQRKPTAAELIRRLVELCGLPPSKSTKSVMNREQLAELLLYIDKLQETTRQQMKLLDMYKEASTDAKTEG